MTDEYVFSDDATDLLLRVSLDEEVRVRVPSAALTELYSKGTVRSVDRLAERWRLTGLGRKVSFRIFSVAPA